MASLGNPDFDLYRPSEEHDALREAIRALATDKIAPRAAEIDETGEFPHDVLAALTASDFHAIHVPEEYGGAGGDALAVCIVIVAAMGIAFFLPPVGVGLTIAAGVARVDIDDVSRAYVPYLVALLIGLALIGAFPFLTLVLPRLLLGYKG